MKLTKTLIVGALALMLPAAVSAATLDINGTASSISGGDTVGLELVETDGTVNFYTVAIGPTESDVGPYHFELQNNSTNLVSFSLVNGTIDQSDVEGFESYGFFSGANAWFASEPGGIAVTLDGAELLYDFGDAGLPVLTAELLPGQSTLLSFFFDSVVCAEGDDGASCPTIDFTVRTNVSEVPVPAAGFLLLGALGGLAVTRRRKS